MLKKSIHNTEGNVQLLIKQ